MKELLILRHGITVWNELKITQGRTNNSLSERGEKEVENTALAFKDKKVDLIYCSPLKRTIQTAEIFNFFHNSPIIFDDRLIEIDQGIFSGRSTKDLTDEERVLKRARDKTCGMESVESVFNRVKDFWFDISKNCKNDCVLIVTHDLVAGILEEIVKDPEIEFSRHDASIEFKNAQLKSFNLENINASKDDENII